MRKGGVYPPTTYQRKDSDGKRHPHSVLCYKNERGLHPTQKPTALLEFLVQSYSNENDIVLDPFMGSGTTAIACALHNRRFIGIEKERKYFDIAVERMRKTINERDCVNPAVTRKRETQFPARLMTIQIGEAVDGKYHFHA